SGFMEEFRRKDFIVSWGMAAKSAVFSALKPEDIADVLHVLKARTAPPGSVITIDGEKPGALFMVGSGEVEIRDADRPELATVRIGEGAFWGTRSLLTGEQEETATALTVCDLIVLDQEDFRILSRTRPDIHRRLLANLADVDDPLAHAQIQSDMEAPH
ncbi:MAG: cyclic nucleotide-binding domain-containing protein, partial [Hyphococcus sp.]